MTQAYSSSRDGGLKRLSLLIAIGWLGTNLGLAIGELPLKFLLKDDLHLTPERVAGFFVIGQFVNYIKPVAGLLTDSFPLFGTRRRWYLLLSLLGTGIGWLFLAFVPRAFQPMLITYTLMYTTVVFTSTTLGGVMVETGMRHGAEGRLTAQRISMFRVGTLAGGPIAGWLTNYPFLWAAGAAAFLHICLVPLFFKTLPEKPTAKVNSEVWTDAGQTLKRLLKSKVLFAAAGMICLIAASPGFNTPLLFYQTNTLHLTKQFVGSLLLVSSATGIGAAVFYYNYCKKWTLRRLLTLSILIHAIGTLTYFMYQSAWSAVLVTAIAGVSGTLAMLPVYDLATRSTPKGCEALGYSVMMSVWNLTNALSDLVGSKLYSQYHFTFMNLIWVNAGTTALVLIAVPFLPAALAERRDGASVT